MAATNPKSKPPGLSLRDLYVFALPSEITSTLTIASVADTASLPCTPQTPTFPTSSNRRADGGAVTDLPTIDENAEDQEQQPEINRSDVGSAEHKTAKVLSCHTCSSTFTSVTEQRSHSKSDWHRYNLKLKIQSIPAVLEEYFDKMVGDLDESISGSESDHSDTPSDGDGGERQDPLETLMKRQASISTQTTDVTDLEHAASGTELFSVGHAPMVWFRSSAIPDSNVFLGVYKVLFTPQQIANPNNLPNILRQAQQKAYNGPNIKKGDSLAIAPSAAGPTYFLCMLGGGHFSAMIVGLSPRINRNPKTGSVEHVPTIIAHKSFHRYTTRRKQGGSQSTNDAAKGTAHSAGSGLRRYNESALELEIRDLLVSWKRLIDGTSSLFIRVGRAKWTTLFGPENDPVIKRDDPRIRRYPFTTRRATQSELVRAFSLLTKVEVARVDEDALENEKAKERALLMARSQPTSKPTPPVRKLPTLSLEDQEIILHTDQLTMLIKRSKAPGVINYLESNGLNPNTFRLTTTTDINSPHDLTFNTHTPTVLHLAASLESGAVVIALLTRAKADPTIQNGEGRVPFQLAKVSHTRDAFRIGRYEVSESSAAAACDWDWDKSYIPTGISKQEVEDVKRTEGEKAKKEAEKSRLLREEADRVKAADRERKVKEREEEARIRRFGKGIQLGENVKTDAEIDEENSRGLTPQMKRRLESEKRWRAIEARLKRA